MTKIRRQLKEKQQQKEKERNERILQKVNNKGKIKSQEEEESEESEVDEAKARKRRKETKKAYPVCVEYHHETRTLAICLIDRDVKIYSVKQVGLSGAAVTENYSFYAPFLPCTAFLEKHKISNNMLLCLASQEGHVEVISLQGSQKRCSLFTCQMDTTTFGPISKIYYS